MLSLMITKPALSLAANSQHTTISFTPVSENLYDYIGRHGDWIRSVLECQIADAVVLETGFPFDSLILDEVLKGAPIPPLYRQSAIVLREHLQSWSHCSESPLRINLAQHGFQAVNERVWDARCKDLRLALWFRGLSRGVAYIEIPSVTYQGAMLSTVHSWVLLDRADVEPFLGILAALNSQRKSLYVEGGVPLDLDSDAYDWDRVVLDPHVQPSLRDDFEVFWKRRDWFHANRLPYRRGYLLYGPPGNGKTSVVRLMASHPSVFAFSIDLSAEEVDNNAATRLFQMASRNAPAVIVLEDLDRHYARDTESKEQRVKLPHLLNCLDGIETFDSVVVVATANDATTLDPAILRRPGRFDRVVEFSLPGPETRQEYFRRIWSVTDNRALDDLVQASGRLSFAQLQESYIVAGQFAYQRADSQVRSEDILKALEQINQLRTKVMGSCRALGFASTTAPC
jgi:hypothetical protein